MCLWRGGLACFHGSYVCQAMVYAERKRRRADAVSHPREWQSHLQISQDNPYPLGVGLPDVGVHRLPFATAHQRAVLMQWTPAEWLANVRVSRECFDRILRRIEHRLVKREPTSGGKRCTPGWCQLAATLAWLGGGRPADLQQLYCMRRATFHDIVARTVHLLAKEFACMVAFPSEEECVQISDGFSSWSHFPGVVGAVDGIIIPCKLIRASLAKAMRCERKACFGFNLQAVCNHRCEFTFVSVQHFASVHDGRALRETTLWSDLENGLLTFHGKYEAGHFFLLGDNAYALRPFLLHPWKGRPTLGSAADSYNFYQAAARSTIERAFGQLVLRWQRLHTGLNVQSVARAQDIITACCALHNLCKKESIVLPGRPATGAGQSVPGTVSSMQEALVRVSELEGYTSPEPRQAHDRHVAVVESVVVAQQKRQTIAYDLLNRGYVRPDCVPNYLIRCPDETESAANGLCY